MKKFLVLSSLLLIFFSGCANSGEKEAHILKLKLQNVPTLESGYYKVSLVEGTQVYPVKRFQVKDGKIVETGNGRALKKIRTEKNIYRMDRIQISINSDETKYQGESVILLGDINRSQDTVELSFQAVNLKDRAGNYALATLTDNDPTNEKSGIWFIQFEGDKQSRGLTLAPTPWGWTYEGWIEYQGTILSTGRFGQNAGEDLSKRYSLPINTPQFPGEDFLNGLPQGPQNIEAPINLADGKSKVFITLEPDIDGNDTVSEERPFSMRILSSDIPEGVEPHISQAMQIQFDTMPIGTVEIE